MPKRLFITICVLIMLSGCSDMSINKSEFNGWDKKTSSILQENFSGILPDSYLIELYGTNVYHRYSEALLGDKNLVIYVELKIKEESVFSNLLCKGKYGAISSFVAAEGDSYYLLFDESLVLQYLDGYIYDGMNFDFAIISANEEKHVICYLVAHVSDNYRDEFLVDYLDSISMMFSRE